MASLNSIVLRCGQTAHSGSWSHRWLEGHLRQQRPHSSHDRTTLLQASVTVLVDISLWNGCSLHNPCCPCTA